jgi:DNA gyrase subunit A
MDVPFGKFRDKSVPIDNISTFSMEKEQIILAASQSDLNLYRVMFFTKQGMCKLVDGGEFDVAKRNVAATKLQDDDEVVGVEIFKEQKTVVLQSAEGYFLRFGIDEIPEKKKAAVGVRAIKLVEGDTVSAVYCLHYNDPATIEYKSKQLELNKIKLGKRDSKGVKVRA